MVHSSLVALAQAARRAAPRPRKAALELTDAAVERVKGLLEKRNKVRQRVYGCAGNVFFVQSGRVCRQRRHLPPTERHAAACFLPSPAAATAAAPGVSEAGGEDAGLQRHGIHPQLRRQQGGRAGGWVGGCCFCQGHWALGALPRQLADMQSWLPLHTSAACFPPVCPLPMHYPVAACSLSPACPPAAARPATALQGRFDEVVEVDGGVKVLIDPAALMHVLGTRMDYVEDRLK